MHAPDVFESRAFGRAAVIGALLALMWITMTHEGGDRGAQVAAPVPAADIY